MAKKIHPTVDEAIWCVYGYVRAFAEMAKDDSLYDGFTVEEVMRIFLSEYLKDKR